MTQKQRLLNAIRKQPVDRPPWICPGGMMNLVTLQMMDEAGVAWPEAHTSSEKMARLAAAAHECGCFENYGLPFCMTVEVEGMGAKIDMGSKIHEPHVSGYPINSVDEWESLPLLDCTAGRAKTVIDAICILAEQKNDIPIIGNLTGPVSVASSLIEPTTYYKELRKKKENAHKYMERISDHIADFGLRQLYAGADIIAISDPSGTGEILGPKLFEEYVVPYLNRIIGTLKGTYPRCEIIVHICGQMHSVYPQLSQIECNTLSFDALVNLKEARQSLPEKVIMGNVSTYALEFADPNRVREITRGCLKSGAGIISPACGLGSGSPVENLRSALEIVQKEGGV